MNDILGHWDYSKFEQPTSYGQDITYKKAMAFLDNCNVVEDWGCGTTYAKTFRNGKKYIGIDGSRSKFADIIADLREYRSQADGIIMRHILEHNYEWRKVLTNAVSSFRNRMVLITFTPFVGETHQVAMNFANTPDIFFRKEDITACFTGLKISEETCYTEIQYGPETLFYLEKPSL